MQLNGQEKSRLRYKYSYFCYGWKGHSKEILNKCEKEELILITSLEQFEELSKVLDYLKFNFTEEQKNKFKNLILEIAEFYSIINKIDIIKEDPDDNIILETAIIGKADYIITGDSHLLKLKRFRNIKIIKPKEFITRENI